MTHPLDKRRGHSLMPSAQELVNIPTLYASENDKLSERLVHLHYFIGSADWWLFELDPADRLGFGFVCLGNIQDAELGYVGLDELADLSIAGGMAVVERDLHWQPKRFGEIDHPAVRRALARWEA